MSNTRQNIPCTEWAEKLAALHPDDLSARERGDLNTHLASCSNCAQVQQDYRYLASLVRDSAITREALPDLLLGPKDTVLRSIPISQPGVTSSLPAKPLTKRRPWKASMLALAGIAAVLVASILLGNFAINKQPPTVGGISQPHPSIYYINGSPITSTPIVTTSPMLLSSPASPFFLQGNLYRGSDVYRADTGAPLQQYLKELGNGSAYDPTLVDGILYMTVSIPGPQGEKLGTVAMYALHASDRTILWKWDNCGGSSYMTPPIIANGAVYFMCDATPHSYKLYALQAKTGKLLWVNTLSGEEIGLDLQVYHHEIYIHVDNQLLAENTDTGKLLWKQSFGGSSDYINSTALDNGILYINQVKAFFALQASNGARMWEYHFTGDTFAPRLLAAQGVVYLFVYHYGIEPTTLYSLDGVTGMQHWHKQLSQGRPGFPLVDHGNLYMVMNVYTTPRQTFFVAPSKRILLAIQGSDGGTLWQRDIPWNKGKLTYAASSLPPISAGDGRIYLADWLSTDMQHLTVTMGAFNESNGSLAWTRDIVERA